ncbi:hypothetical protein WDU94_013928 [Cyamophila willieti]
MQRWNYNNRQARQKHFCKYCSTLVTQLPRHLKSKHKAESEIKFLTLLTPRRKRTRLEQIRKEGAVLYNHGIGQNDGKKIICSRPQKTTTENFRTCPDCKYAYQDSSFTKHVIRCSGKNGKIIPERMSFPIDDYVLEKKVLNIMKTDVVFKILSQDETILKYGSRILHKNRKEQHIYNHVSNKMRDLAKLVLELGSQDERIKSLKDAISPIHFMEIVKAVKVLGGYQALKNTFQKPSLPMKLGQALKKCADILIIEAIYAEDIAYGQQLQNFVDLYEKDWHHQLGHHAQRSMYEGKFNKFLKLPESNDITTLMNYLDSEENKWIKEIENSHKSGDFCNIAQQWKELASLTLVNVLVFNRRRSGEISRLELTSYRPFSSRMDVDANMELLDDMETKLSSLFQRIEIRGKKGRRVALLLTPQLIRCCDVLVKHRKYSDSSAENPYFFSSKDRYIRGSECLNKITKKLELENITSTNLRKHVATMIQIMSLSNNELQSFADCMGHNLEVHKEFYSLSNDLTHRAKFAKLFMCLTQGKKYLHLFKKKNFNEIDITNEMLEKILGTQSLEKESEDSDSDTDTENNIEVSRPRKKQSTRQSKTSTNKRTDKKIEASGPRMKQTTRQSTTSTNKRTTDKKIEASGSRKKQSRRQSTTFSPSDSDTDTDNIEASGPRMKQSTRQSTTSTNKRTTENKIEASEPRMKQSTRQSTTSTNKRTTDKKIEACGPRMKQSTRQSTTSTNKRTTDKKIEACGPRKKQSKRQSTTFSPSDSDTDTDNIEASGRRKKQSTTFTSSDSDTDTDNIEASGPRMKESTTFTPSDDSMKKARRALFEPKAEIMKGSKKRWVVWTNYELKILNKNSKMTFLVITANLIKSYL